LVEAEPFFEIIGGSGGIGAVPFFEIIGGSGGIGAVPFFKNAGGSGGIGAVPLAINTEESPWVVTTVFRPIAPVKTSMARKIADEIRDIVPPGGLFPERTLSFTRAKSRVYCINVKDTSTTPLFDRLLPIPRGSQCPTCRRVGGWQARVNSTLVLAFIGLTRALASGVALAAISGTKHPLANPESTALA
jgi:hypothetical protein